MHATVVAEPRQKQLCASGLLDISQLEGATGEVVVVAVIVRMVVGGLARIAA